MVDRNFAIFDDCPTSDGTELVEVIRGDKSYKGKPRDLVMPSGYKDDGKIIVGQGSSQAAVSVIGDATLSKTGVLSLVPSAGVAALLAAGLGKSAAYPKTTAGAQTLLASQA